MNNMIFVYLAFRRLWQHDKYSYWVWGSFAHQASTILRIFKNHPKLKSENNSCKCSDLGPPESIFFMPARTPARYYALSLAWHPMIGFWMPFIALVSVARIEDDW